MTGDQTHPAPERDGIVVYGTEWCRDCTRARRLLERNQIADVWIDIDEERRADAFVRRLNQGRRSVPTILLPDGSILVEPSDQGLTKKLGLPG